MADVLAGPNRDIGPAAVAAASLIATGSRPVDAGEHAGYAMDTDTNATVLEAATEVRRENASASSGTDGDHECLNFLNQNDRIYGDSKTHSKSE
jgi:hypothetical protein